MKVTNVRVYDLEESMVASGFPMLPYVDENKFEDEVKKLRSWSVDGTNPHYQRILRLASAPDGSGHRNALSGVLVSFNVTGTNAWWMQFERYHFIQIVSSMSKMHRLKKMIETDDFEFHDKVFENGPELLKSIALETLPLNMVDEEELVYNCPMGLELTARVTTNYLQLRTIYVQRRNHKLKEWRDFCDWIKTLPYARELITLEEEKNV